MFKFIHGRHYMELFYEILESLRAQWVLIVALTAPGLIFLIVIWFYERKKKD